MLDRKQKRPRLKTKACLSLTCPLPPEKKEDISRARSSKLLLTTNWPDLGDLGTPICKGIWKVLLSRHSVTLNKIRIF